MSILYTQQYQDAAFKDDYLYNIRHTQIFSLRVDS